MDFLNKTLSDLIPVMMLEAFFRALLVAFFTLTGTYLLYFLNRKLPSKLIWNLDKPKKATFILATSASVDTGRYIRHTTGIGQVRAIGWLIPSFESAYGFFDNDNVFFSETVPSNVLTNDLVVIGGVKNNKITRELLSQTKDIPYTQEVEDGIDCIFDKRDNKRIVGKILNGEVIEDYGLIIRMPNPKNTKKTCLIFLSVHTYGLDAAASMFVDMLPIKHYAFGQSFICLVRTKVNGNVVNAPEIIDYVRLRRSDSKTYWMRQK